MQAEYLPVIKAKQRTAFPPNYIHSLDSAHMMLTAVACDKAGASACCAARRRDARLTRARCGRHHVCGRARLVLVARGKVRRAAMRTMTFLLTRCCPPALSARSVDEMSRILRDTVRAGCRAQQCCRAQQSPYALRSPPCPSSAPPPQFVELHGEPLLEQLYESFRRQYPEVVFREPPKRGSLRLEDVRRSTYFFS